MRVRWRHGAQVFSDLDRLLGMEWDHWIVRGYKSFACVDLPLRLQEIKMIFFSSRCHKYVLHLNFMGFWHVRHRRQAMKETISRGTTVRNSTFTEELVFHKTLSTSKASYSEQCPSGTPQRRTRKIHIFSKDPIMRTSYNTSPFHTLEFLRNYIITLPNVRVWNDK